jgi:hypothetical protein
MKELLVEFLSQLLNEERKFKAVKVTDGEERVSAFSSQANADAAVQAGTHRKYNPQKDKNLPGAEDDNASIPPRAGDASWPGVEKPTKPVARDNQRKKDDAVKKATGGKVLRTSTVQGDDKPSIEIRYVGGVDNRLDITESKQAPDKFDKQFPLNEAQHKSIAESLKKSGVQQTGAKVSLEETRAAMGLKRGEKTLFPPKYISAVTNLLNHKNGTYTITQLTGAAGAGTLDSTAGEILGMIGMSIADEEQRNKFFDFVEEKVREGNKTSPVTEKWIKSARATAAAFSRKLKRDCPNGHSIVSSFWDIPQEAAAAGVKNYKGTKGKSTDVNVVVDCKGKDGKTVRKWYQPSLKKDKNVNGFNGSTSRVFSVMIYRYGTEEQISQYDDLGAEMDSYEGLDGKQPIAPGSNITIGKRKAEIRQQMDALEQALSKGKVPPAANVEEAKKRQQKIHTEIESDPAVVDELDATLQRWTKMSPRERDETAVEIVREMLSNAGAAEKGKALALKNEIIQILTDLAKNRQVIMKSVRSSTGGLEQIHFLYDRLSDTRAKQKLNIMLISSNIVLARARGKNPTELTSMDLREQLVSNAHKHSEAVLKFLTGDVDNRKAFLRNISTAFPLKDLLEGKENAILGEGEDGINLDEHTIRRCLNLEEGETFDDVVERMTITNINGKPTLVYSAGSEVQVPIGIINMRPDGIGYGNTWKLEMNIHGGLADCCKSHDN